jgi:tRNA-Thr(GGU) m(6)t(6)A37 methyltransferase TsaA
VAGIGERQELEMNFEPIGIVKSAATEPVDENWGHIVSEIYLAESYTPGLRGLEQFSHLIVLFCMHQATFHSTTDLVRRPRGRADMPELGIFAQRARHRPNPIGITAVELIAIAGNVVKVKGLDAIDGTPVLDLKPYVPVFDCMDRAIIPEWMKRLMEGYF